MAATDDFEFWLEGAILLAPNTPAKLDLWLDGAPYMDVVTAFEPPPTGRRRSAFFME